MKREVDPKEQIIISIWTYYHKSIMNDLLLLPVAEERFVLFFHACFAPVAVVALGLTRGHGWGVLGLVVAWHAGMMLFSTPRTSSSCKTTHLRQLYQFCALTSVLQVLPDWFLVTCLNTLEFPDSGVWRIGGAVSCYMAGMWAIPFMLILVLSNKVASFFSASPVVMVLISMMVSLTIFASSEYLLFYLQLWQCNTNVVRHLIGDHVAIYVLPAEALLGPTVLYAYSVSRFQPLSIKCAASLATMLVYTGALAISYLLIEGGAHKGA